MKDLKEIIYNKLIRDRIPEITKADGWISKTRILNKKEYLLELSKKILEEAKELNEGAGHKNLVEELVDLQEIIDAILAEKISSFLSLEKRKPKNAKSVVDLKSDYF